MDRRHKNRRTDWRAAVRLVPNKCASDVSEPFHQHPWSAIWRSWVDGQKWQPLAVRWQRLGIGGGHPARHAEWAHERPLGVRHDYWRRLLSMATAGRLRPNG